jgi:glyoxylase-like metal-dependent hydrolase (beta-lactamase superfamily II)
LKVTTFQNKKFTSNAYLITRKNTNNAVLIDIGEYSELRKYIFESKLIIDQLFLTHGHYDHIFGIKELITDFPKCKVYAHSHTLDCIRNTKLNLSYYYDFSVFLEEFQEYLLKNNEEIIILNKDKLKVFFTPGHNLGSVTYSLGGNLFTGDSYIPFIPVVTKLKGGNRIQNMESLSLIQSLIKKDVMVFPGHGIQYLGSELLTQDRILTNFSEN